MGVNIKEVNVVVHYDASHNIDDYFQQEVDVVVTMHALSFSGSPQIVHLGMNRKSLRDKEINVREYLENTTICR